RESRLVRLCRHAQRLRTSTPRTSLTNKTTTRTRSCAQRSMRFGGYPMIVIVDEREAVMEGYRAWFDREGVSATGLCTTDFDNWVKTVSQPDILAVEAFLLGDCRDRHVFPKLIKGRSPAPVIAMNDAKSLEETLDLFAAGVDDVVRKPVHVREIL